MLDSIPKNNKRAPLPERPPTHTALIDLLAGEHAVLMVFNSSLTLRSRLQLREGVADRKAARLLSWWKILEAPLNFATIDWAGTNAYIR